MRRDERSIAQGKNVERVKRRKNANERLENRAIEGDSDSRFRSIPKEKSKARDYSEIESIEKGGPIAMADFTIVNTAALEDVKKHGNLPIPMSVRNAPTKLMKELEYGKGYKKYSTETFLPEKLKTKKYYKNTSHN